MSTGPVVPSRPCRVAVLYSSYEKSSSVFKSADNIECTPAQYWTKNDENYVFESLPINKATSFIEIRALVQSKKYDVFLNLCDGALDEDRAGVDVVRALEFLNVPFTGANSHSFEIDKVTQKMMVAQLGIDTADYALVGPGDDIRSKCAHLKFPTLVKHFSGYGSIGMRMSSKCASMEALIEEVTRFRSEVGTAVALLIEEFISGEECSVLTCADIDHPEGIRVFHPLRINFKDPGDFKHFDLKWVDYRGMPHTLLDSNDPLMEEIRRVGFLTMKHVLNGVGYGRLDLRIDRHAGRVVFLEVNPNCGLYYPPEDGGAADLILIDDPNANHEIFTKIQIKCAHYHHKERQPKHEIKYLSKQDGYGSFATQDFSAGDVIACEEHCDAQILRRITPMVFPTVPQTSRVNWIPVRSHENPNCKLAQRRLVATQSITRGAELLLPK